MSHSAPTFVVTVVAPETGASEAGALLKEKLRRRGLRVHMARSLQEPEPCEYDILLVTCHGRQLETLAQQIEQRWTQRWAAWYEVVRQAYDSQRDGNHRGKKRTVTAHGR